MMTVTGAARIFGALPGEATAASLALPSALLTQTKRAGQQLPEVGPNFTRSYRSRSCCSVTGRSVHALRVRAVRNSRSSARSSSLSDIPVSIVHGQSRKQRQSVSPEDRATLGRVELRTGLDLATAFYRQIAAEIRIVRSE